MIGQKTDKYPGDFRKITATQTQGNDQLILVSKTCKEQNNNNNNNNNNLSWKTWVFMYYFLRVVK